MECYALHIKTVLRRPVECGLHAAIGVMNQTTFGVARRVVESLFQRIERLIAAQRLRYALADDAPSERIDNECDVHETAPRRNVHEVRHPQHIGTHDQEVAVHQIGRAWQLLGRRRCLTRIPLRCAYNSILSIFGAFGNPGRFITWTTAECANVSWPWPAAYVKLVVLCANLDASDDSRAIGPALRFLQDAQLQKEQHENPTMDADRRDGF